MYRRLFEDTQSLIVVLFMCALAPGIVLATYRARVDREERTEEVRLEAARLARLSAFEEQRVFYEARQFLLLLSHFNRIDDPKTCNTFLREVVAENPRYAGLSIAYPNGDLYCHSIPADPVNISDLSYFQHAIRTREFSVGGFKFGQVTGVSLVHCAQPILGESGEVQKIIVAAIPLQQLNEIEDTSQESLLHSYTLAKVDPNGVILAYQSSGGRWITGGAPSQVGFSKALLADGPRTVFGIGSHGEAFLYAASPVKTRAGNSSIYIVVGIPEALVMAAVNRGYRDTLIALLCVTLLGLAAAMIAARIYVILPARALIDGAKRLESGDMAARTGISYGRAQMGRLAKIFDEMAAALQRRDTEHRTSQGLLEDKNSQLRDLAQRLRAVREEERARISREIHDQLGQSLLGLRLDLFALIRNMPSSESLSTRLHAIIEQTDEIVRDVQRISSELRPIVLDLGLPAALEWQAEEFESHTGICCEARLSGADLVADPELALGVFRVVQESLTNVARHSGATRVEISFLQEETEAVLEVRDNGRGIAKEQAVDHHALGIVGMRERVSVFGGQFSISGLTGIGTVVLVRLPIVRTKQKQST